MRCNKCGVDNPEDVAECLACGALLADKADTGLEIEVYDLGSTRKREPSAFEKALAARANEARAGEGAPPPDVEGAAAVRAEVEQGYEIRRRRLSYRVIRPRNVVIFLAAVAILAVCVVFGVRWAVARLPKYEYAKPAHAEGTARAFAFAARLESAKVDLTKDYAGPTATLAVAGGAGKVFVDGNYVADAPTEGLRLPVGPHHVIVKYGKELTLDETVAFREGENYKFELGAATALAAPVPGTAAPK